MSRIIEQVKSDNELIKISCEIVDLLDKKGLNVTEKYKIVSTMAEALEDVMKELGYKMVKVTKHG